MKQEKTSMQPSAKWRGSGRLLTMLIVASIAMIALCLSGCASTRKSVNTEMSVNHAASRLDVDSTVSVVESWQTPMTVPMSSVSLTLPLDSLRKLPQGAGYTAKKGRANVKVTRKAPTKMEPEQIIIEANCDSLQLVCARYSKTISTLKRQLHEAEQSNKELKEEKKEKSSNSLRIIIFAFIAGVAAGIVLIILTRKKKWQKVF
nr:MAG TPA: G-rich domain on putative tyrosine kinase [Caudoviricetes sp.]